MEGFARIYMNYFKRVLMIVVLLSIVSGCAYFRLPYGINKPSLTLVDITLKNASLLEQTFVAELRIENPNDFNLPIDNVDIELALEDQTLGEGTTSQDFVVPANGEATFKMKIHTHMLSNLVALKKIVDAKPDHINYRLTGSIDVGLPLFIQDIHFKKTDSIPTPNFRN